VTMFLSRLRLNPISRAVRADLADCQSLHRTIMSAFGQAVSEDGGARATFSTLHRVDTDPRTGTVTVYVQSEGRPDWTHLPQGYLLSGGGPGENPACKAIADALGRLEAGDRLRFRLRANPTRKIDTKSGPDGLRRNGRRVELRTEEDQLAWLSRKAASGGFEVLAVRVDTRVLDVVATGRGTGGRAVGAKWAGTGGSPRELRLTFTPVLFDGHLRVTDPDLFRRTMAAGIGPGKAYGFGLLSLAPGGR